MPGNITGITITYTGGTIVNTNTYAMTSSAAITNQNTNASTAGTAGTNCVTWTFDGTSPYFAIGMIKGGTSGNTYCGTITITYTTGGGDTPSISANNVNIAYDATSGAIGYTINNGTGSVTAAITGGNEGNWLTLGTVNSTEVPFTCSANNGVQRTATVTLSYTGASDKVVTVTQAAAPTLYTTIPELFSGATTTETPVLVSFNNWIVSGVSTDGKSVFVTDNSGNGFVIFSSTSLSNTYSAGNILSGTVPCTLKKYNGYAELLDLDASGLTITSGGTVTVANIAMADLTGINTGALVSYNNLTCSVSNNKYYLSDGTTTLQVYNALYAFTLQDGYKYNITGVYQQYNSTKEILPRSAADIVEVQDPVINANNVTLPYDATSGEIAYTISHPVTGVSLMANLQEGIDWISNIVVGTESVTFTTAANEGNANRTATITLSYTGATDKVITVTQLHYVADYATLPFAFDGGVNDIESTAGLTGYYIGSDYNSSPKLKFNNPEDNISTLVLKFNERPGTLTFDIKGNPSSGVWSGTFKVQTSEDGETYTDLETYTNLTTTVLDESFDNLGENVRYIKWIYTEKVSGNVALGNISLTKFGATTGSTVNAGTLSHVDIYELWDGDMNDITLGDVVEEGTYVYFSLTVDDGYTIDEVYVLDATNNEVELDENQGSWSFYMPNSNVTINATATENPVTPIVGDKYVKVTATEDLADGQYLIVYEKGNVAFDGSLETLDAENNTISVAINGNEIAVTNTTTDAEFTIDITNGTLKSASGLYIGVSSNSNGLKQTEDATTYTNSFSIDGDGNAIIAAVFEGSTMTMRYNNASNQNRFRYYKSGQQAIQLYKKVEEAPVTSITINGYGNNDGGYYLIASPVAVNPAEVDGMIITGADAANYDLYSFDQTGGGENGDGKEWRNYKQGAFNSLVPGKGYLYANKTTVDLTFTNNPVTGDPIDVDLVYNANATLKGYNLIGNPFSKKAYIGRAFYVMNEGGTEIVAANRTYINPMEGVFVIAADADDNSVTFSTIAPDNNGDAVALNVKKNSGNVIDRAIVRFDEGQQLPKFQLNPNNTKIYVTEGNQDYAVVRSANEAEMPVSFKASENGTYTLAIETENVEMNYLHLIDNMTGMDVDLLQTPSYTFEAKTNDYTSRFRLVFKASSTSSEADETFAYYNGSNWTVSNLGEATLQVVDVTGRTVSSETINGNATISLNQTPGVYMLRLVNGNSVRTQKIVVR